jgi:oxygen-independent coproporphyrinogen-3 oxidase
MEDDGLVKVGSNQLQITEKGRPYVRNICMAFDVLLQRSQPETQLFSMTV